MTDQLDIFLDELDLQVNLDTNRMDRAQVAQLASIHRLITRQGDKFMASLDNLTAAIAKLDTDVTQAASDVAKAIADLKAQIDALTVGQITQDQIDALQAGVDSADSAVDVLDASVAPAVTPTP